MCYSDGIYFHDIIKKNGNILVNFVLSSHLQYWKQLSSVFFFFFLMFIQQSGSPSTVQLHHLGNTSHCCWEEGEILNFFTLACKSSFAYLGVFGNSSHI